MLPTIRTALHDCARQLESAGVDVPELCAELLLAKSLGRDRDELLKDRITQPDKILDAKVMQSLAAYTARRMAGEPAAYILGEKEFYGRPFIVSPAVLIPRPETELIIDLALQYARIREKENNLVFADFGSGSGCIGVTLALELPAWQGLCLDKSAAAARVSLVNAKRLGAGLPVLRADFAAPPLADASLDLLASNPPYVSEAEYAGLALELHHEPKQALVPEAAGSVTGLEAPIAVLDVAARVLASGGLLLMEIGCTQGAALLGRLDERHWREATIEPDLAGLDRVIRALKR